VVLFAIVLWCDILLAILFIIQNSPFQYDAVAVSILCVIFAHIHTIEGGIPFYFVFSFANWIPEEKTVAFRNAWIHPYGSRSS
jgi:hypothetical protein